MVLDALVGAVQEARGHGPAVVSGREHFVEHGFQHAGQTLTTVFGTRCQRWPASFPEGLVGVLEAWRHRDGAIFPLRADFVTVAVERSDDFTDELARFIQHLLHQVGIDIGKCGQGLQLVSGVQNTGQHKMHVLGAGGVGVHGNVYFLAVPR